MDLSASVCQTNYENYFLEKKDQTRAFDVVC